MKAKILERVAKSSLQQQILLNKALWDEKEEITQAYEGKVKDLRKRLEEKKNIEVENQEKIANNEECKRLRSQLSKAKAKIQNYKQVL